MNAPMLPGHKFASHVSLDAGATARLPSPSTADQYGMDDTAADRLSGFIVAWCALPPKTQRVVSMRLLHVCGHSRHTYVDIGKALRIFPQDAEARLNRALRDMPVLREAFALKEAKKLRRRTANPIGSVAPDRERTK